MAKLEYLRIVLGMMTFLELAHMLDATQLCLSFPCTHAGCYTCHGVGGVGWGGDDESLNLHACWMLRNCVCLVLAHMLDATCRRLCLSCPCTHAGCDATVFENSLIETYVCTFAWRWNNKPNLSVGQLRQTGKQPSSLMKKTVFPH